MSIYKNIKNNPIINIKEEYGSYSSKYENPYLPDRYELKTALRNLDRDLADANPSIRVLRIPVANARLESSSEITKLSDLDNLECYKLFLPEQIGVSSDTKHNLNGNFIFFKFPKSDSLRTLLLYSDGGIDFVKYEHKFILRESDELDRRIIAGFCKLYNMQITEYCETGKVEQGIHGPYLEYEAMKYTSKMQPKRLKLGHSDRLMYESYNDFADEAFNVNMFSDVKFM